jgi:antitoxin (DNA-binding transcriptional repressor) of toxin-antitoxin stability system
MKKISIRQLHDKTGEWVRLAAKHGAILVTDRGKTVAKIMPEAGPQDTPYFSRRVVTPSFRSLMDGGKLRGGADSTHTISEDRERSVS